MFALCVEASHARGMGHLFRAFALAEALEGEGGRALFYVNDDPDAQRALKERGRSWKTVPLGNTALRWEAERIRTDGVRVWINDRLETSAVHAQRVLDAGARLATLNDSGTGAPLADLHVAAIALDEAAKPQGRRVLTGLQYLVLDPAIGRLRKARRELRSLVVSMGGSDTYGLTVDVVRQLRARKRPATVVVGPGFAHEAELTRVLDPSFTVKRFPESLTEEFSLHDLAITAGGVTPFEANAAGLPCIVIGAEVWEERAGALLAGLGGCVYAGPRHRFDLSALDGPLSIAAMSEAALAAVPADGARRVARELLSL
jgi:spore coat polysaccharide biosynthesis predicted glycosyltransferase SpsG